MLTSLLHRGNLALADKAIMINAKLFNIIFILSPWLFNIEKAAVLEITLELNRIFRGHRNLYVNMTNSWVFFTQLCKLLLDIGKEIGMCMIPIDIYHSKGKSYRPGLFL